MRVFIPALSDELLAPHPVNRPAWTARIPQGTHSELAEVYEDNALTEAALDSLELLRDEEKPGTQTRALRRLVIAAEVPHAQVAFLSDEPADDDGVVFPVSMQSLEWTHVVAFMVDDEEAETAVQAVLEAQDQPSADAAIEHLWDYAINWFDSAERLALSNHLA